MAKNLIIVVADTLRRPEGFSGLSLQETMPFLASVLPRAVQLDRLIASSPWTIPSHVSLLTGEAPWKVNLAPEGGFYTLPAEPSIAETWSDDDRRSAVFSANPFVSPANGTARGYPQYFPNARERAGRYLSRGLGLLNELLLESQIGSDVLPRTRKSAGPMAGAFGLSGYCLHRLLHRYTDGRPLLQSLESVLKRGFVGRPAHLLINLMETHEPYLNPRPPRPGALDGAFFPTQDVSLFHSLVAQNPRAAAEFAAAYVRSLSTLDLRLRSLFGILSDQGMLRSSTLLLVSDHGQSLGENGFFGHGHELYEELIHIPGYIWDPDLGDSRSSGAWNADWLDHRHLHDLVLNLAASEAKAFDPTEVISTSLQRRGPAAAYWEGRFSRGSAWSRSDHPISRKVRIFSGDETAEAMVGTDRFETPRPPALSEGAHSRLSDLANSIISQASGRAAAPAGSAGEATVDERLRSWGY